MLPALPVRATTDPPRATAADTVAVGVFEGEDVAHDTSGGELQALLDAGEARRTFGHLALAHADGKRWLVVGLGDRERFDAERARIAAATVAGRAGELGSRSLCWEVPHHVSETVAGALAEGTLLAGYRLDRFRSPPDEPPARIEEVLLSAHHDVGGAVARAEVVGEAVNAARALADTPANEMTPTRLGERALELAAEIDGLTAEVEGRERIVERGMGAFAAVARGTDEEPALITLRWEPADARGPVLGLVGKAVTFDTGGISIKPAAKMFEMKFDMAGGAAVVEAMGAIARLRLPVRVVAVAGATENMPSGHAMKPGDVVTTKAGFTVEIDNTDAEGRLVLVDCMAHARELGAERLVDLATLTGAIVVALGSTYAGLFAEDDDWAQELLAASAASGEELWRMPLHEDYADMIKGRVADVTNSAEKREAQASTAAAFLARASGGVPWAHLDIAGTGWDRGRAYAPKGASGFGVRLLVELAQSVARGRPSTDSATE